MDNIIIPTIVVLAYNRKKSLEELLKSLKNADYTNYIDKNIRLIISIDKSNDDNGVIKLSEEFEWPYGDKNVVKRHTNLGLRKHVLECGDLSLEYNAIIMLEDDLIVSAKYFDYATKAINYYYDVKEIAQISLYTYQINEFKEFRPFIPINDGYDNIFMQIPSSWGQVWTKKQWIGFKEWYESKEYENKNYENKIPYSVIKWKESSWKKYYSMYMSDNNLFTVYPRYSMSTNMGEVGTHNLCSINILQSNLVLKFEREFIFSEFDRSISKYDTFMESIYLKQFLNKKNLIIDYFGTKEITMESNYLLSTEQLNYKIVNQWDLALKPYELNVLYNIKGNGIYLYNLKSKKRNKINYQVEFNKIKYENPSITLNKVILAAISKIKSKFKKY